METEANKQPAPASKSNRTMILALVALATVAVGSLVLAPLRNWFRAQVPLRWIVHLNGFRFGYNTDYNVRIRMADGVELASTLYLPRNPGGKLATIFVRHPYDRLAYGEGLNAGEFFARHGYAVLVQDVRGKFASQGEFMPYRSGASDGATTLDWIARQPWSNGRVGTFGCSALGELQFVLAKAKHPAHVAMLPSGAGGAVGSAGGRYAYFGLYEGGVFQLASGFGWFLDNGAKDPGAPPPPKRLDVAAALKGLPLVDLVKRIRPAANGFDAFVRTPLTDLSWEALGYVSDSDLPTIPALVINTWGDQTVGDALSLAEQVRKISPEVARNQHVVIAPGKHCNSEESGISGRFGDLEVKDAAQPYKDWYLRWFDYWLRGRGNGLADLPPYLYYVIGESRWLTASTWPPEGVRMERWHLDSGGHANGRHGDGVLTRERPHASPHDEFGYDPMNPVPSRGGPLCCSGNPADQAGPVDQRDVEARQDVLVYTSAALTQPLRIAGTLRAKLHVSSSARDTDFVARLVHVWPDGRATNIQEGALRARYRNGVERPSLLEPGERVSLMIDMRSIAYLVPKGHRLRLHITSSSFPRLERNLNTGGRNYDERSAVIAFNRVYHDRQAPSYVELPVLP
ncbi:MAG: CocE/NonD family hydrolase [Burkholderiaceae bacterium]|nr:CocE/NonD family hydrolase [Burkholderiaceae bacterium]